MRKFIIIWWLCIAFDASGQDISRWKNQLEMHILDQSKNDSFLRANTPFAISAIPICYYPCSGSDLFSKKKGCTPLIDSFASFAFLSREGQVIGIAENRGTGKYGFYSAAEQKRLKRKATDDVTLQMIKLASSYSSKCYFLYFFPEGRNRYELLVALMGSKAVYIDRKLKVHSQLAAAVSAQWGPQKEMQELLDQEYIKRKLQKKEMSIEDAKALIQEDYTQYGHNYPEDTVGTLQRFIKEFTRHVPLDTIKRSKLQKAIMEGLASVPLTRQKKEAYRIPFLGRNIFVLVKPFATQTQLNDYRKYRTLQNWLIKKAYEKLDTQ
jgi:hypothetical protein